jgi:hypothetical protein
MLNFYHMYRNNDLSVMIMAVIATIHQNGIPDSKIDQVSIKLYE